jgi:hypothetical protein
MKKLKLLLALCCCATLQAGAQAGAIKCTTERNADNTIGIYAENFTPADYSVMLIFSALSGYSSNLAPGTLVRVSHGRSQIARLTLEKTSTIFNYSYSYRYFPGQAFRKRPPTDVLYLLPVSEGTHVQTFAVNSIAQRLGQDTLNEYHAIGFNYRIGDTICAARAGLVYEADDKTKAIETGEQVFRASRNKIHIQQRDGTLAQYTILAPIKLLVAPGDDVVPGQPLAVFDQEGQKFSVLFSVVYLDEKKAQASGDNTKGKSAYTTVPTVFHVQETEGQLFSFQEYTAVYPKEVVAKELTKREKKKLGLQ